MGTKKSASGEEEPLDLTQISADVAGATVGGILGYLINDPMAPIYGTAAGVLRIRRGGTAARAARSMTVPAGLGSAHANRDTR